jgi:hypothetical protein
MDQPSPLMRDLARRLLAASQTASGPHVPEAVLVIEKLRISLTQVAGADGFASLLRRALALASAEVPALRSAYVSADGRLEGVEQLAGHGGSVGDEEAVAITAQLLGLLVTFIGQPLTVKLVRKALPETAPDA